MRVFPTESEAWDFVENHRDHQEGAKKQSSWKEWNAGRETKRKVNTTKPEVEIPNPKVELEFVVTPGDDVTTPGPHSDPDTEDHNFIKGISEGESEPHMGDDDYYEVGDSEFEDNETTKTV